MMTPHPQASGLNRQARRDQAKTQRRQPAPRRQAKTVNANAIGFAAFRVSKLTRAERTQCLAPVRDGFDALRRGVATFEQWDAVDTAILLALAIEAQGIVRGLGEHLQAAARALAEIRRRVEQQPAGPAWGRNTTLHFEEIAALRDAIHLHDYQLQQLSVGELHKASESTLQRIRRSGGTHMTAADSLPQPVQERLV